MRKYLLAAAVALPLALMVAPKAFAGSCCPPPPVYKVGISIGLCFRSWCGNDCGGKPACGPSYKGGCCGSGPMGCGYGPVALPPWYTYYPYGAHFQSPAPTGYPMWPAPQASGPTPMFGGNYQMPYQQQQQMTPFSYPAAQVQPVGYQVPSYWYGR